MRFFGDWNILVRRAADRTVVHAKVYDRHSLAFQDLPSVERKYSPPDFLVQVGTWTKYLPSLRGHPKENALRLAQEHRAPEELVLEAWQLDHDNSRDIERKVAFIWRKYFFVLCATIAWVAALIFGIMQTMNPWEHYGLLWGACWIAAMLLLYFDEKEWGFALFLTFVLFIGQLVVMMPLESGWRSWLECKYFGVCG